MKYAILLTAIFLCLNGCTKTSDEFKAKLYTCNTSDNVCTFEAKFKTMDLCNFVRQYEDALCDTVSEPGKAICTFVPQNQLSAYTKCQED